MKTRTEIPKVARASILRAAEAVLLLGARRAVVFQHPRLTVTATRRHKPSGRSTRTEVVLTIGAPNWAARKFIKRCIKAGVPFPVKRLGIRAYSEAARKRA